ncbi:MAG: 2-oxoacid:acceptor oxidoreductase family protein [Thermoplasmata archaeon]|nr:2-oxoacid:acceptor oxidoreductase family protein [Thermoplasmata archaeon]
MKRVEIKFGGFGGQGIILMGNIAAKAAVLYDGKNAVFTPSYGPEARGGAASSNVVISDDEIDYPYVTQPDVLVVMSQEAYEKFAPLLKDDGLLIIDEDLVKLKNGEGKVAKIPATRIAEGLGKRIVANIVMLGFFTAVTNLISYEAIKKAVLETVPAKFKELNEKALELGYEQGIKWREE